MLALLFAALVAAVASLADAKGRLDPTPLFKEDHPNVTYLTDHNYNQLIRDAPLDGKPWLIDFYHPYCPHCKQFVPVFTEIAAHYKPLNIINVGAMSCMDWEQCAVYKIKGFPTLGLWNFDNNMNFENKRAVGEHSRDEVFGLVAQLFREQVFNATGSWPVEATTSSPPGTTTLRPLWEESTLPSNATTRVLDAASAFVFGMRESVFTGRSTLEDIELDALKEWLRVVSLTFPGEAYRHLLANLYKQVAPVAVLTQAKWRVIFHGWQNHTAMMHKEYTKSIYDPEEWELLPTLFEGYGTTYYACELYTCGQWTMFHLMTMMVGPSASDELAMAVVTAIRRFVKNFLTCLPCRKHFLAYNTLELVEKLDNEVNKPKALYMWLWTMHNAVNKRIRHFQWPKPDKCPTCGVEDKWRMEQVEHWMKKTYGFESFKQPKPVVTTTTTRPPTTTTTTLPPIQVMQTDPDDASTSTAPVIGLHHKAEGQLFTPDLSFFALYLVPVAVFIVFVGLRRMRSAPRQGNHLRDV